MSSYIRNVSQPDDCKHSSANGNIIYFNQWNENDTICNAIYFSGCHRNCRFVLLKYHSFCAYCSVSVGLLIEHHTLRIHQNVLSRWRWHQLRRDQLYGISWMESLALWGKGKTVKIETEILFWQPFCHVLHWRLSHWCHLLSKQQVWNECLR